MAKTKNEAEAKDSLNEEVKLKEVKVIRKPKATTTAKKAAPKAKKEDAEVADKPKKTTSTAKKTTTTAKKTTSTAAKKATPKAEKAEATEVKNAVVEEKVEAVEVKASEAVVEEPVVVETKVEEAKPIEEPKFEEVKVEEPVFENAKAEPEKEEKVEHLPEHGPIAPNGKEILLSLKNVDITFGKKEKAVEAVKNATFDIYKGETFSLVGESGSGKTTIGRAVIRVNPLAGGEIRYKGVRISGKIPKTLDREVIRNIQMVFQDPAASLNERATVEYIVSEGLYNFHLFENEADRIQKVEKIIEEVGLLPEHLTRYPHEFSGGQRQRIGIARAIVMEPELIVADEPISALDVSIRAQILNLLNKFKAERGLTCLFIAHDLSIVRFISDRIGVIYKGDIVEVADAEELFEFPLHPYTRSLISAIPIPDPQLEKNKVLFTYDPTIHDYSVNKPSLVDIGHGHLVFGNEQEIAEYKNVRESGKTLKSITILSDEEKAKYDQEQLENAAPEIAAEEILNTPLHDTGSFAYTVLAFLLPIIGLIFWKVFKKKNYIRNYKAFKNGSITGFIVIGAILLFYLLALLFALV